MSAASGRPARNDTIVVLFTRDLRVRRPSPLGQACRQAGTVVPLFVLDPKLTDRPLASSNRLAFLLDSLRDLRRSLIDRGGQLYVRIGDPATEALKLATTVGADGVFASADVSPYARSRHRSLARACHRTRMRLVTFPGVTVVPPDDLAPYGGDHYRVFTPYWRKWRSTPWRTPHSTPRQLSVPAGLWPGPDTGTRHLVPKATVTTAGLRWGDTGPPSRPHLGPPASSPATPTATMTSPATGPPD